MLLRSLALIVTDDCNFRCHYCYKKKRSDRMPVALARRAATFFLPRFARDFVLAFYGGEPLLAFDVIEDVVRFIRVESRKRGRRPRFAITTNGSLSTPDILQFFGDHRFRVTLSFDGARQNAHRGPGGEAAISALIDRLSASSRTKLEVNCVFTPATVASLEDSLASLLERGVPRIRYSLSMLEPWSDADLERLGRGLAGVRARLEKNFGKTRGSPVVNFREGRRRQICYCPAGQDRLAVDPKGNVWGCVLFADYVRDRGSSTLRRRFSYGRVDRLGRRFADVYRRVTANYACFSMDRAATSRGPCFLCPRVNRCWVCPVNARLAEGDFRRIPDAFCKVRAAEDPAR
ncbi:MAG: radical SAM protein [Candidatus Aminicenantes bacterium]|nr:radical SAM protein [Candidatus Aminicenantes bacterium]